MGFADGHLCACVTWVNHGGGRDDSGGEAQRPQRSFCRSRARHSTEKQLRLQAYLDATIMCVDYLPEDLTRSRPRWYDLPAFLLLHRPVRCRMCDRRYYTFRKKRVISPLATLWMHYAILISVVCLGVGIYQYQQNSKLQEMARQPSHSEATSYETSRTNSNQDARLSLPLN